MRFQSPRLCLADTKPPPPGKTKPKHRTVQRRAWRSHQLPTRGGSRSPTAGTKILHEEGNVKEGCGDRSGDGSDLMLRGQFCVAPRLSLLGMSKQACPLVAGTAAPRKIPKYCTGSVTLPVSRDRSWLKLRWHSACYIPLEVKSNLTSVCVLTTAQFF